MCDSAKKNTKQRRTRNKEEHATKSYHEAKKNTKQRRTRIIELQPNKELQPNTAALTKQGTMALRAPPPPPPPEHSAWGRAHLYPDAHGASYIHASPPDLRCLAVQHG